MTISRMKLIQYNTQKERKRERYREGERGGERERDGERDVEYGCFILFLKRMMGALAPFSYLVLYNILPSR
jgi:hypothetical protein